MDIQRYQKNFFELAVGVKSHHIQHALNRRQLQGKPDDHSSEDGHDRFMHSLDLPGLQNIAGEEAMISRPIKIDSAQEVYISFCAASELVSGSGPSPLSCCAVSRSAVCAYSANPMSGGGRVTGIASGPSEGVSCRVAALAWNATCGGKARCYSLRADEFCAHI